jgi:hypothetical protein
VIPKNIAMRPALEGLLESIKLSVLKAIDALKK